MELHQSQIDRVMATVRNLDEAGQLKPVAESAIAVTYEVEHKLKIYRVVIDFHGSVNVTHIADCI